MCHLAFSLLFLLKLPSSVSLRCPQTLHGRILSQERMVLSGRFWCAGTGGDWGPVPGLCWLHLKPHLPAPQDSAGPGAVLAAPLPSLAGAW